MFGCSGGGEPPKRSRPLGSPPRRSRPSRSRRGRSRRAAKPAEEGSRNEAGSTANRRRRLPRVPPPCQATPDPDEWSPGTREKGAPTIKHRQCRSRALGPERDEKPKASAAALKPKRRWLARAPRPGPGAKLHGAHRQSRLGAQPAEARRGDARRARRGADQGRSRRRHGGAHPLGARRHAAMTAGFRPTPCARCWRPRSPRCSSLWRSPSTLSPSAHPHVILLVGVNGTGKTTTAGQDGASLQARRARRVMLAAARHVPRRGHRSAQSVGRTRRRRGGRQGRRRRSGRRSPTRRSSARAPRGADVLLIDTAGRLQNKSDLMAELAKIVRVLKKLDPSGAA